MNGYHKYIIPCSLLDIQGLERFFEKKAEKGNLIRSFSKWNSVGKFEEVLEGNYHFCIDIYRKKLSEKDEGNPEFLAYIEECESVGWTYTCTLKNLVIFYSKDEVRPLELKRNQIAAKQYLYDITMPEEKNILLRQAFNSFSAVAVWILLVLFAFMVKAAQKNRGIWIYCMIFLSGLVFVNMSGVIAKYIQNQRIGKALKMGKEHLLRPIFWNEEMIMSLTLLITEFALFLWSYQIFSIKSAILSSCAVVISASVLCFGRILYRLGRTWKYPSVIRIFCLLPLILLAVSIRVTPAMGSYRYQIRSGESGCTQTTKEEELKELGLKPEVLGWGTSDFVFLHKNKNPLCSYEYLIYNIQNFKASFQDDGDYEKNLRYIGTASAKLKNEKALQRYLKQKEIDLKQSIPFELLPEVSSYIEENGKALIHIKGNLVIIYFLNEYDDRSFDISDQGKLKIYRETLERILENMNQ